MPEKVEAYFFGGEHDKQLMPVPVPLRLRVPTMLPEEPESVGGMVLDINPRATSAVKLRWYRLWEYGIIGPALEHRYARVYIAEGLAPMVFKDDVRFVFRWPEGTIHDHEPRSLAAG